MTVSSPPHFRRNFALIFGDFVLFGVALALVSVTTVVPEFVRHFTDSAPLIGLVPAVWNGSWLIPQLVAAQRLAHRTYKQRPMILVGLVGRPAFALFALALALGAWRAPGLTIGLLLLSVATFFGCDAFNTVAWFDIVAKTIPAARRGRLFGSAQFVSSLCALGIAALVGFLLGPGGPPFPYNFIWLFALASPPTLVGLGLLALIREPPESSPQPAVDWRTYLGQVRGLLLSGTPFRHVTLVRLLAGLAGMATPFYVLYATGELGFGPEVVGVYMAALTVGGLLGSTGFGALYERSGPSAVIRGAVAAGLTGPLLALLTLPWRGAGWLWLPYAAVFLAIGAANSASMLGWLGYVIEIAPPGQRPTYTGLANTLTGLLIPVPILGGWLLQETSYPALFAAAALGPAAAWLLARTLPKTGA